MCLTHFVMLGCDAEEIVLQCLTGIHLQVADQALIIEGANDAQSIKTGIWIERNFGNTAFDPLDPGISQRGDQFILRHSFRNGQGLICNRAGKNKRLIPRLDIVGIDAGNEAAFRRQRPGEGIVDLA